MNIKINDKENMSKIDKEFDEELIKNIWSILADSDALKTKALKAIELRQFIKDKIKEITDEAIKGLPDGYSGFVSNYEDGFNDGVENSAESIKSTINKYLN